MARLVKVRKVGSEDVYDLTIDQHHNYIANGIVVHNCMKMPRVLAGFTGPEADHFRKGIKLKDKEKVHMWMDKFVSGCKIHSDINRSTALRIWKFMENFAGYGFCKCISGDTILHRAGGNQYAPPEVTVRELYRKWKSNTPHGKKLRRQSVEILQMDNDGRIRPRKIKAIYRNGSQNLLKITTENGRVIKVTHNHRLLTDSGYKRADEISCNDNLVCCGSVEKRIKGVPFLGNSAGYDGNGFPIGEDNPAWIDGRSAKLKHTKIEVLRRSNNKCEKCGVEHTSDSKFEFAHTKVLEKCGGDYLLYNDKDNIKFLCDSCHKKYDYAVGVRIKRWHKGRITELDKVINIEDCEKCEMTYDVEMDSDNHNFVANGIVSHNSHAASYGVLAYATAWLKVHYHVEYMAALLSCNTDDHKKLSKFITDLKRDGIKILPPHINKSSDNFTISKSRLLYPLQAIKKVGGKALENIIAVRANGEFKSLEDFIDRVDKRVVNIGVISNLILSGSMRCFGKTEKVYDRLLALRKEKMCKQVYCLSCKFKYPVSIDVRKLDDDGAQCPNCGTYEVVAIMVDNMHRHSKKTFDKGYISTHVYGFSMEDSRLKQFVDILAVEKCNPLSTVEKVPEGRIVKTAFEVVNIKKHTDKNGNKMAFLDITDGEFETSLTIFASSWTQLQELIQKGDCYVAEIVKSQGKYLYGRQSSIKKLLTSSKCQ